MGVFGNELGGVYSAFPYVASAYVVGAVCAGLAAASSILQAVGKSA